MGTLYGDGQSVMPPRRLSRDSSVQPVSMISVKKNNTHSVALLSSDAVLVSAKPPTLAPRRVGGGIPSDAAQVTMETTGLARGGVGRIVEVAACTRLSGAHCR